MCDKKVSILVAVYNTEHFLRDCLDSLINQSHRDIQIICIDDASTDGSLAILNEYAALDNRIIVLRNEVNSGQSKARNHGLKYTTGDYICMVDSDDTLAPDAIAQLVNTFTQHPLTDCVLFNLVLQYPDGTLTPYHNRTSQTVFSGDEALCLSIDWSIHGVYALRADIHKSIPYDESTRYTADDITTKLHYHASREVRLSNATYYYRQHDNSISNAITIRRFDVFVADFALKKHLEKLNCKRHIMQRQERYRWHNLINYWYIFSTNKQLFTPQEQQEIEQSFDFHASTLDHTLLPLSLKLRTLFIPFLGIKGMKFWAKYYCSFRQFILKK